MMTSASKGRGAGAALLWLLGGWLFASIAIAYVAGANFAILDTNTLRHADEVYAKIPAANDERYRAVRYAASEINRHLFKVYNAFQLGLAGIALALFLFSRRHDRTTLIGLVAALVLCAVFLFWFTPEMIERGRAIDFVPRDPMPASVVEFQRLHQINVWLEIAKMAILVVAAVRVGRFLSRAEISAG